MTWRFLFSRWECKNCTCPDIHRHFNSQLPCRANGQWYTSGFLTRSSDQSERSLVNQIRRSIFLSSSLLPSLCVRNACKAHPRPGLSIENVLKLHAPLHCTAAHNFCQKRVFIICPIQMLSYTKLYDIRDSRLPSHSLRILRWPEPAKYKILPRPCGPVKYARPELKFHSSCRHFLTCVPN